MIEINLIPDVKLELIKAKKIRAAVVSVAIIISIAAGGIVALLAFYTFGFQNAVSWNIDSTIKEESDKLSSVQGLSEMLTIKSQLNQLSDGHSKKVVTSRLFDVLTDTVPDGKNSIAISKIDLSVEDKKITIEAEAKNGYEALEVYKKTLAAATFVYSQDGKDQTPVNVATDIKDLERSFGDNSEGNRVLRFSLSFTYAPELFMPNLTDSNIDAPNKQNATDSARGVPKNLFTDSPEPSEEGTN